MTSFGLTPSSCSFDFGMFLVVKFMKMSVEKLLRISVRLRMLLSKWISSSELSLGGISAETNNK